MKPKIKVTIDSVTDRKPVARYRSSAAVVGGTVVASGIECDLCHIACEQLGDPAAKAACHLACNYTVC